MDVPTWLWWTTIVVTVGFLLLDVLVIGRRPHEPSTREVSRDLAVYIGAAVAFGIGVWVLAGGQYGGEFFAGWLTEYSLSIDNLFIFIIIMTRLQVPRQFQQTALLIGIVIALVMRGVFIAVGAAAINEFSWVFYLFGLFLVYTAYKLAKDDDLDDSQYDEPRIVRFARTHLRATSEWNGVQLTQKVGGSRLVTPMFIVVLSLGVTDLLFALMGLRQLYFLIGDLLQRLVYLSYGLAVLLAFIGVKLILHAMHENELPFINGGEHVAWAPDIPIWLSLVAIVGILGVTTVLSLAKDARDRRALPTE